MAQKRPLIGITLDSEKAGGYSNMPWYAVRENYCDTISQAGGVPITLPHEPDFVDTYLDHIDGLLITGGNFDVDPSLFGAETRHDTVTVKEKRTKFEWGITEGALKRDMPILGICGGQQLLHVVVGGTLIQHIPDSFPNCLAHEQPNPRTEPGHNVDVTAGTKLAEIVGKQTFPVNSAHHQAIADEPKGVKINAVAPDGVIEGMEIIGKTFCMGVQWHPEYHISPADEKILEAFVAASAHYQTSQKG